MLLYTNNEHMKKIWTSLQNWKQLKWPLVQLSSVAQMCLTLQHHELQHARPPCPSPTPGVHSNSRPSSPWCHPAIFCRPLLLLPPIPPSIRVFSNESTLCMRWPKYWSFSFSISPSNEHSGLISFRMDWLDLLAIQGTLKSLLQHHSSKASILHHSAFFTVQLSHPYMTRITKIKTGHTKLYWFLRVSEKKFPQASSKGGEKDIFLNMSEHSS